MSASPVPSPTPTSETLAADRGPVLPAWLIIVLVAAIGLNLRASLGSYPPLLDHLERDLALSSTAAGLLTSVAIVCMGLCAPLGARLGRRIGNETAVGLMMAVLAAASLLRAVPAGAALLMITMAVAGAAMGGVSALMPALIAHHLPRIRGLTMGIYSTGLAGGVAIAAAVAVPLEEVLGGWRLSLATWGVIAAVTSAVWLLAVPPLTRRSSRGMSEAVVADHRLPWRSATAWWVTLFTTFNMIVGFSGLAWVTPLYLSLGKSAHEAAGMLVLFQLVQLSVMLTLPAITDHTRDRRPLLLAMVALTALGIGMILVDPLGLAIPAVVLFGIGVGGGSTIGLVLIVDVTDNQADAGRLGAMTLLVAFLTGALGPFLLGLLKDLTGGFTAGYAVMLALTLGMVVIALANRPGRTVRSTPV